MGGDCITEASKAICNHIGEGAGDSASKTPESTMHTADLTQGNKAWLRRRLSLLPGYKLPLEAILREQPQVWFEQWENQCNAPANISQCDIFKGQHISG